MARLVACPHCGVEVDRDRFLICPNRTCRQNLVRAVPHPRLTRAGSVAGATDAGPPETAESDKGVESSEGGSICTTCQATLPPGIATCPYCGTASASSPGESELRVIVAGVEAKLAPRATLNIGRDGGFSALGAALASLDHVSRQHARIEHRDDGLWITDMGSVNGTFVGERRLHPWSPERIEIGASVRLASNVSVEILSGGEAEDGSQSTSRAI